MQSSTTTALGSLPPIYSQLPQNLFGAYLQACLKGELETVKNLLKSNPEFLYYLEEEGENGFIYAFAGDSFRIQNLLLELGFDQNKPDSVGWSSFARCVAQLCLPIVEANKDKFSSRFSQIEFLLSKGADTNFEIEGKKPLPFIEQKNFLDCLISFYEKDLIPIETLKRIIDTQHLNVNASSTKKLPLAQAFFFNDPHKRNELATLLIQRKAEAIHLEWEKVRELFVFNHDTGELFLQDIANRLLDTFDSHRIAKLYKKERVFSKEITHFIKENLDRFGFALEFTNKVIAENPKTLSKYETYYITKKEEVEKILSSQNRKNSPIFKKFFGKRLVFMNSFDFPIRFERVKMLVEIDPALLNDANFSPLLKATLGGNPKVIKFLKDKGAFKKNQSTSLLKDCFNHLSANFCEYRERINSILACIDLYIREVEINVYNKEGLSFINFLIFHSKSSPIIFDYLRKWSDLNWDLLKEDSSGKNAFCYALETLNEKSFEAYFVCFPEILFPIPKLNVFKSDDLKEKAAYCIKEISNRIDKVLVCETFKESYLLLKEAYSYFKKIQDLRSNARVAAQHEDSLVERLLGRNLLGVKEKKTLKEKEELLLVFENLACFNFFKTLLETFEVSINESDESKLCISLSNAANKELPSSQISNLLKKYHQKACSYQTHQNKISESKTDPFNFGTHEIQAPKIKVAKVSLKPTAKELKTKEIAAKLQNKNLEKQRASLIESAKPKPKPEPLPPNVSKNSKRKEKRRQNRISEKKIPISDSLSSNIQERIPIHEIPLDQLTPLPKKTNESSSLLPIRNKKKSSVGRVHFTPQQKNRLQIAINACDRISKILEEIKSDKPFLLTKSVLSEIYIKSLSYQILRFCEALAPTSSEQKDEKDVDFFKEIYQFFLDKDEIRAIRRGCRTSFCLLDPSLLFDLSKTLVEIGLSSSLKEFSNMRKAPEKFTRPCLHLLLKMQIPNFKMKLKEMPPLEKKAFLLEGIYNEIDFIERCIKASDDKETFNSYLDAIKKALSDLSKFASLLSKENPPLKLLKLKSLKWLVHLGNKVAHHLKKGTEIGKPIDEVNISKIWSFFDPKNNYALQLKEAINRAKS